MKMSNPKEAMACTYQMSVVFPCKETNIEQTTATPELFSIWIANLGVDISDSL